jgi:hypothetical protein
MSAAVNGYFELPSEISDERAYYFLETGARRRSPTAKMARNERVFHDSLEGASGDELAILLIEIGITFLAWVGAVLVLHWRLDFSLVP